MAPTLSKLESLYKTQGDSPAYDEHWGTVVPLGRGAATEEMVGACVYFASDDASYTTGQILYVDGGWTITGNVPET